MTIEADLRIGIDLGGTKIAGIAMDCEDRVLRQLRRPTPRHDYAATIYAISEMVEELSSGYGARMSVGVGIPGSIVTSSGRVQNANSTWLNGQLLVQDLEAELGCSIKCANDANCFALSECHDGAAAGMKTVFGAILGTGCGGGLVFGGQLVNGPRNIGGEWGHNPLPWPTADEVPGPLCWCGRSGCLEAWVSGPALAADYTRATALQRSPETIAANACSGDLDAVAALQRHASRLARGLAHVVNMVDPDAIVLGGGLSELSHLYETLPSLIAPYIFSEDRRVEIRPPKWGSASGVRGAARLWSGPQSDF